MVEHTLSPLLSTLSVHFNSHFPGGLGLTGTRMSPFWVLLKQSMMEMVTITGPIKCAKLQFNRDHMQTNIQLFTGRMPFLSPNQWCQSTERISRWLNIEIK